MTGLLIVNADDLGFSRAVSDATMACFDAGGITSATALVWMRDSERAARMAGDRGLPVGLHLNLTVELASLSAPPAVRARQRELVKHFGGEGQRNPRALSRAATILLRDAVRDQLDRLRETYGEPTHVDGHHHVHIDPEVLEAIPPELPVRPALSHPDRVDAQSGRRPRGAPDRGPLWAFAFEHVHPALGGSGPTALGWARRDAVEVMAHPAQAGQLAALRGETWAEMIGGLKLGSYSTFRAARSVPGR